MTTEERKNTLNLDRYTDNLTEKVSKKAEDYQVYGRDKEVEAVQTTLLRQTKSNPILSRRSWSWKNSYCWKDLL